MNRAQLRCLLALPALLSMLTGLTGCGIPPTGPTQQPLLPETPRVAEPRDMRGIPACRLLPPTEATALGLDITSVWDYSPEECIFSSFDNSRGVRITSGYTLDLRGGMDPFYRAREVFEKETKFSPGIFEPGTIDGYPTINISPARADTCQFFIGVADDQTLVVLGSGALDSPTVHACDVARAVTSAVLANLPPLQRTGEPS
jgi:hypothetical protein